jgi:hypothetical protein
MAALAVGAVGISQIAGAGTPRISGQAFGAALKNAQAKTAAVAKPLPGVAAVSKPLAVQKTAAMALDKLTAAQARMDHVLAVAQSGKTFTPAELLSLQTQVYRASQELDLAGKVVDKTTGGVKQILQTQV